MKLDTIGKNIRKFRLVKKLRQEDLAEKTDLTTNYWAKKKERNGVHGFLFSTLSFFC